MATTPSEPARESPGALEGRLHPLSWLFVFMGQLKNVALPLLALLIFGRGQWWELMGAVAAGPLALYALIYSIGFRYRLGAGELVVKEGVIDRAERHVPFSRIQNVVERRNPLHRLFGVTELRLESAGGSEPEAVMNVIRVAEARRIEEVLREAVASRASAEAFEASGADAATPLVRLGAGELVRLGLATNRGVVILGGLIALFWQFEPWERASLRELSRAAYQALAAWNASLAGPLAKAATLTALALAFLVTLKLLSIAMAVVTFHGFRLVRRGERITTEGGLLTRHAASAQRDKVQRLLFEESWLARRLGQAWLTCDVAAGAPGQGRDERSRLRWLVPIGTSETLRRVADQVAPGLDPASLDWRPLHPRAWRRRFKPPALVWSLLSAVLALRLGPMAVIPWLSALVLSVLSARGESRYAAYACDGTRIGYRSGWLRRRVILANVAKGQAIRLSRSPFDRRAGMATVALDTAGAASGAPRLRIPYLAEADARALVEQLRAGIAGREPAR
jgi:putative membrane protein